MPESCKLSYSDREASVIMNKWKDDQGEKCLGYFPLKYPTWLKREFLRKAKGKGRRRKVMFYKLVWRLSVTSWQKNEKNMKGPYCSPPPPTKPPSGNFENLKFPVPSFSARTIGSDMHIFTHFLTLQSNFKTFRGCLQAPWEKTQGALCLWFDIGSCDAL